MTETAHKSPPTRSRIDKDGAKGVAFTISALSSVPTNRRVILKEITAVRQPLLLILHEFSVRKSDLRYHHGKNAYFAHLLQNELSMPRREMKKNGKHRLHSILDDKPSVSLQ